MVLNLYLFRHGETEENAKRENVGGQSNHLPLSERGEKQAKALGERLKKERIVFDEVYCSTAVRAKTTAKIVSEIMDFPAEKIITTSELLEMSQGDWEGKPYKEVQTPEVLKEMKRIHWEFKAPNGESQKDLEKRKYDWVWKNLIANKREDLTVGMFGHGMAIKCFLRGVMKSDPSMTYKIVIDNCSITRISHTKEGQHEGWSIVKVNDNAHLNDVGFVSPSFVP